MLQELLAPPDPDESQPGTSLVPLNYGRRTFNVHHKTYLETHNALLDAEAADQINEHYTIEIYGGIHSMGVGEDGAVPTSAGVDMRADSYEYTAAAKVVEDMLPGDTLFCEGYNYGYPVQYPPFTRGVRARNFIAE